MNGDGGPEETGGAVGAPRAVPIDQWDLTVQMAYWGFHHQRRQDISSSAPTATRRRPWT
ncbi:hypothetical protein ACFVYV_48085 [Streptomyces mirabilis]|uniref:hypothetical protein n=1 Tax=Streptomyces mirabilis TaxID=68239 RepID=UPI0036DE6A9E